MDNCLTCRHATMEPGELRRVYCRYADERERASRPACARHYSFLCRRDESLFDFLTRLIVNVDAHAGCLTPEVMASAEISRLQLQITGWHARSAAITNGEVNLYRELLCGLSLSETIAKSFVLMQAIDRAVYPGWIQAYWSQSGPHGSPIFNVSTLAKGYLLAKRPAARRPLVKDKNGYSWPLREDELNRTTPSVSLTSFVLVPRTGALRLEATRADNQLWSALQEISDDRSLRIGVSQTDVKGLRLELLEQIEGQPCRFVSPGCADPAGHGEVLKQHLARLANSGANLVVFPELAVPAECQSELLESARGLAASTSRHPVLLVAGSYHRQREDGSWENAAPVYGAVGDGLTAHFDTVFTAVKVEPVYYPPGEPVPEELRHPNGALEGIRTSGTLRIIDTPIGRILVVICKDCLVDTLRGVINRLRPDIVLVPAMSGGIDRFASFGDDLARRNYCVTAVANSVLAVKSAGRGSAEASLPRAKKAKPVSLFASPEIDGFVAYVHDDEEVATQELDLRFSLR